MKISILGGGGFLGRKVAAKLAKDGTLGGRKVTGLTYTAHEAVAARLIGEIEQRTRETFGVPYCRIQHRLGQLAIGDLAIVCVVRAPHRAEAFEACRWAVDAVKHGVPVWKEEFYADGSSAFVEGCCIRDDFDDGPAHRHGHPHEDLKTA